MPQRYEYYDVGDASNASLFGKNWGAQNFTVVAPKHTVTSVKLKLWRSGSPGTVTVSIRATDENGHPTGGDLTSGTTDGNTLPTGSPYEWREIALTEYTLSVGTKYAIVCRAPDGNGVNYIVWRYDASDPEYAGGNYEFSSDSGASWSSNLSADFMFEVWGNPAGVSYTQTISEVLGMSDSIARRADFKKTVSESLGIVEAVAKQKAMHQTVSEVLGMRDMIESRKHKTRIGDLPDHTITGGAKPE